MTVFLDELRNKAQIYGIKNKEFEGNAEVYKKLDRQNGKDISELIDRTSKLAEQTTQFNSRKRRSSNGGTSGFFCVALSASAIFTGAALMAYISVTLGAIITAIGCLGLAISLYQFPQSSLQNLSEVSQHKEGIKR